MVCKELMRDHYDLINGVFGEVQISVDEKMGIHIKPVKSAYPTERVDTWAHSLEDPTVDQSVIERRGQSGAENIGNSMHDDCVKENAKLHDKAGLDCYLVRDAGGGCCPWCAAIAGRYKYADAPDDIFRRHDHCTCTTTYECGRMRQDVWSKRTWQASDKELEQRKALSEASKPTVNTPEQAKELEKQILEKNPVTKLTLEQAKAIDEQSKPTMHTPAEAKELESKVLDKSGKGGIMSLGSDNMAEFNKLGRINTQPLEKEFGKLKTDEIVVTDERLEHIRNRHPEDFELFEQYGTSTVETPDLIIKDEKSENTVFMVKRLDTTNLNVVAKLILDTDNNDYKNSVMTFYRIRDKNLKKIEKRNKTLYKRE
jgi:hypothetical protein